MCGWERRSGEEQAAIATTVEDLVRIGRDGEGAGQFLWPNGLAFIAEKSEDEWGGVAGEGSLLAVTDFNNNRCQPALT